MGCWRGFYIPIMPHYTAYLLTIGIGALIGYFTNWLAIKMLMRPHRAHYLFGYQLPFTPGLIPKEKDRLAASIGETVSQQFFNPQVLEETLLSEKIQDKVCTALNDVIDTLKSTDMPLSEYLGQHIEAERVETIHDSIVGQLSTLVADKICGSGLGKQIAESAVDHAIEKMEGGVTGWLGIDKLIGKLRETTTSHLARHIDEMLSKDAPDMTRQMVTSGIDELMATTVGQLANSHEQELDMLRDMLCEAYRTVIQQQLPRMLQAIDIRQVVEQRVQQMDVAELERLIFDIMDKELTAIVWLGCLLGALIGAVNCFFL